MTPLLQKTSSGLIVLLTATSLISCGGGGATPENAFAATSATAPASVVPIAPDATGEVAPVAADAAAPVLIADVDIPNSLAATVTAVPALNTTAATVVSVKAPVVITNLKFESTTSLAQTNVPVTFGQVFAKGDLMAGTTVYGVLGDGTRVPLQIDAKARHADGSLRHAVISTVLPQLASHQLQVLSLDKITGTAKVQQTTPAALINAGFRAAVSIKIDGQTYTASADELLKSARYSTWLSGPLANEWMVSAPLRTPQGVAHPHLSARFAVRSYTGMNKARVDVTVENDWAYEAAPQNFTYDALVSVGGQKVFDKVALTHFHHARWRKIFWWGDAPQVHVVHNTKYLIHTRALPNYDQSVVVSDGALTTLRNKWMGPATEPMGVGAAVNYMPMTGGRGDIGLLPAWSAMYLLSMDKRAKDVMLGTADLAGSWSSHFRDKTTDRPISVMDHPYMTLRGRSSDTFNRATGKYEAFPDCATAKGCDSSNTADSAHQPNFAYLPYLVTGDYYYLEELQFWSMYNELLFNPSYREHDLGLIVADQMRAQGWSLRTLSEAAYISPDIDPLKAHFTFFLKNNLDWYNKTYVTNTPSNVLGFIMYGTDPFMPPWQDDFFTSAVGHTVELGFEKAIPLLGFKVKFPIARLISEDACWIDAAIYHLKVRDTNTSPYYTTIGEAYRASHTPEFAALKCGSIEMAASLHLQVGEMPGYSSSPTGFPSNMQPAVAYASDAGGTAGAKAWAVFSRRTVKPKYSEEPQFAIVPR